MIFVIYNSTKKKEGVVGETIGFPTPYPPFKLNFNNKYENNIKKKQYILYNVNTYRESIHPFYC